MSMRQRFEVPGIPELTDHPLNLSRACWYLGTEFLSAGAGNVGYDVVGRNHVPFAGSTAYGRSDIGVGFRFFGGAQANKIFVPTNVMAMPTAGYTVSAWVLMLDNADYLSGWMALSGDSPDYELYGSVIGAGASWYHSAAWSENTINKGANQINHLAFVNPASGNARHFINGVMVGTQTASSTPWSSHPTVLGARGDFNGFAMTGHVSHFGLWRRPLSDAEVFEDYSQGLRGYPDLVRGRKRRRLVIYGAGATFNPAWARGSNQLIGSGLHVS